MAIILIKSTLNILHKYDRSAFCIAIVVNYKTFASNHAKIFPSSIQV